MTQRDELLALADDIERWRRGHAQGSEMLAFLLHPKEQIAVIAALRLAASPSSGAVREAYPSQEAMKAAVELEIHAALGSVQTVVIGRLIQQAIDAAIDALAGGGEEQWVTKNADGSISLDAYAGWSRDKLKGRCRELIHHLSEWQFHAMDAATSGGNKIENVSARARVEIQRMIDAYSDDDDAALAQTECGKSHPASADDAAVAWQTVDSAPTEHGQFFLLRVKGRHPARGALFTPMVAQQIDGDFYSAENELDPIKFGTFNAHHDYVEAARTDLEWHQLPPYTHPAKAVDVEAVKLGSMVTMNDTAPFGEDWRGVVLKVVGLHLAPDGDLWADVIEGNPRHRGNGQYDSETTDINVSHLSLLTTGNASSETEGDAALAQQEGRE